VPVYQRRPIKKWFALKSVFGRFILEVAENPVFQERGMTLLLIIGCVA
jgi:hypothetical protein